MSRFRLIPWEYAIRNLFRRPARTALTLGGLTIVVLLVLVVVGFIRGLERTLELSGEANVTLVYSLGMGKNLEYSSIAMRTGDLLAASVDGIEQQHGRKFISPELYLATDVMADMIEGEMSPQGLGDPGATAPGAESRMGLVRGVTPSALLVRRRVQIEQGNWPKSGEVIVGRLAATKMGVPEAQLAIGRSLSLEGRRWRICGIFSAAGSTLESEIWCRLDDLQQAMRRQDLSLVAVTMAGGADPADVDLFCKERLDLELQATGEREYYGSLQKDYRPVRLLAWSLVLLISGAGVFAGLNTMHGSVLGRTAELSMLQTIGFARRAVLLNLIEEGVFLASAASLLACGLAIFLINGAAVRFTMGAFTLHIDSTAVLIGCGVGLFLGIFGAVPPAARTLRMPIAEALKAV